MPTMYQKCPHCCPRCLCGTSSSSAITSWKWGGQNCTQPSINSRFTQQRSGISYNKEQPAYKIRQFPTFRDKKHCANDGRHWLHPPPVDLPVGKPRAAAGEEGLVQRETQQDEVQGRQNSAGSCNSPNTRSRRMSEQARPVGKWCDVSKKHRLRLV